MNYVSNYTEANEFLSKGRNKDKRTIDNNTTLENRPGCIAVKYHNTDIVCYYPDGKIKLSCGGWRTRTTKDRLNSFAPIYIYQRAGSWYISKDEKEYFYADDMIIRKNGSFPGIKQVKKSTEKKHGKLVKSINKYSKDFALAMLSGDVPAPSGGDCWICSMFHDNSTDHLTQHIKEKYYVPSLFINAEKCFPVSPIVNDCIARIWSDMDCDFEWLNDVFVRQVSSTMSKHLKMMFQIAR